MFGSERIWCRCRRCWNDNFGKQAEELLAKGVADAVVVGPALVWSWAEELGIKVRVANQIGVLEH